MKIVGLDYITYVEQMQHKECVFIDPPWRFNDNGTPHVLVNQVTYKRWDNNHDDLLYLLNNLKCDYLFVWTTNSLLLENFTTISQQEVFVYRTIITWVKQTSNNLLFYGLGHHFRNSTEQILVLSRKGVKPLRSKLRNCFLEQKPKLRTKKPKNVEFQILSNFNKSCYLFSGGEVEELQSLDIDCVDLCFVEDVAKLHSTNYVYKKDRQELEKRDYSDTEILSLWFSGYSINYLTEKSNHSKQDIEEIIKKYK